jgi:hypothetical protein
MHLILEQTLKESEVKREDGGQALIATIDDGSDEDTGIFVRLQSWDESTEHKLFNQLINKKVRITIETIEE